VTTSRRSRSSIWSLTQFLYIIAINAYITSLLHGSDYEIGGSIQLLLAGGSMAMVYVVLAYSMRPTTSSELDSTDVCFLTDRTSVTQLSSFALGIATVLMVFVGERSRSLLETFVLGVAQALQWSSLYCLVRPSIWFRNSIHHQSTCRFRGWGVISSARSFREQQFELHLRRCTCHVSFHATQDEYDAIMEQDLAYDGSSPTTQHDSGSTTDLDPRSTSDRTSASEWKAQI
jgi:hypothetical protein